MMLNVENTPILGLHVISGSNINDSRGTFARLFCETTLAPILGDRRIVQINRSLTRAVGTIRGMHFQRPPFGEMKFVRCLRGRVFDVAVDLRRGSSTFLSWHGVELAAETSRMFAIPEGFAHGFQVLEADSELLYLHTAAYNPSAEGAVHYNDARLSIIWPHSVTEVSERDKCNPMLDENFQGLAI